MIIKTEVGRRKIEENGKLKSKGKRLKAKSQKI